MYRRDESTRPILSYVDMPCHGGDSFMRRGLNQYSVERGVVGRALNVGFGWHRLKKRS